MTLRIAGIYSACSFDEYITAIEFCTFFSHPNFSASFMFFSGAIGSRLSADAASIRGIAGDVLSLIVQNISTAIVGIVIAMVANWKLACIVICFVPCVFAQSYAQARFMRGFSADAKVYGLIFYFHAIKFKYLCSLFSENL